MKEESKTEGTKNGVTKKEAVCEECGNIFTDYVVEGEKPEPFPACEDCLKFHAEEQAFL